MNDAVDYVAINVNHISNVEISCEYGNYTANLEVRLCDMEELNEINHILQKYHEKN